MFILKGAGKTPASKTFMDPLATLEKNEKEEFDFDEMASRKKKKSKGVTEEEDIDQDNDDGDEDVGDEEGGDEEGGDDKGGDDSGGNEDDLHKDDQDIADEEGDLDVAGTSKNKRKRKCSKEKDVTFLDEGRGDYVEKQMFHAKQVNILKCNYFLLI